MITETAHRRLQMLCRGRVGARVRCWAAAASVAEGHSVSGAGEVLVADMDATCVRVFRVTDGALLRTFRSADAGDVSL